MKKVATVLSVLCLYLASVPGTAAQRPDNMYKIHVNVVERAMAAISYRNLSGPTEVGFRGASLKPGARGEAKMESKRGYIEINAEFADMIPANRYGREYLTYVLWAVTPEGRPANLGELILKGTKSKLDVTTDLQAFGMVVTAEPYFAVTQPSNRVVLENYVRQDTVGRVEEIAAKYELMPNGAFAYDKMSNSLKPQTLDFALPLDLQEARNAVRIAKWAGAEDKAWDVMSHTEDLLDQVCRKR